MDWCFPIVMSIGLIAAAFYLALITFLRNWHKKSIATIITSIVIIAVEVITIVMGYAAILWLAILTICLFLMVLLGEVLSSLKKK